MEFHKRNHPLRGLYGPVASRQELATCNVLTSLMLDVKGLPKRRFRFTTELYIDLLSNIYKQGLIK